MVFLLLLDAVGSFDGSGKCFDIAKSTVLTMRLVNMTDGFRKLIRQRLLLRWLRRNIVSDDTTADRMLFVACTPSFRLSIEI